MAKAASSGESHLKLNFTPKFPGCKQIQARCNICGLCQRNAALLDSGIREIYIFCLRPASAKIVLMTAAMTTSDEVWMRRAIEAAVEAMELGEIPIGACLIDKSGEILAVAGNRTRADCDPTAHAEIVVLREAARRIGNFRLTETVLYTTIEPCAMCAGALVQARIGRLVFGAHDERFGAVETLFRVCDSSSLNHQMEITSGVLAEECRGLMQDFFRRKRLQSPKSQVQSPKSD